MKTYWKNGITMGAIGAWASSAMAQTAAPEQAPTTDLPLPLSLMIFLLAAVVVVLLALIWVFYALSVFLKYMPKKDGVEIEPLFSFNKAVPIHREHEILLDHDYDGIRELDNRLPPWWVYMFYATIVFGVAYMWFFHIQGTGNIQEEEYQAELKAAEVQMLLVASKMDENSVTVLTEPEKLDKGKATYISNCAACHGKLGEGGVGPNLTDAYWIHGGDIKDLFKTIKYGVPAKGMIPWQGQLSPTQMQEVSSYILTLAGTNPPNPKEPQGELYTPEK